MYNVQIRAGYKDSVGWGKFVSLPPPYIPTIMMYIKLLVLVGFDLNFPLISCINKLYQIKTSFPTFQLFTLFYILHIVINLTFTVKKLDLFINKY